MDEDTKFLLATVASVVVGFAGMLGTLYLVVKVARMAWGG